MERERGARLRSWRERRERALNCTLAAGSWRARESEKRENEIMERERK